MHSVNITSSTACPGLCGQTTVWCLRVLTQAHCVSNYTGCRCPAISNTNYVCWCMMYTTARLLANFSRSRVRCGDARLRSSSRGDFVVRRTSLRLAEKLFSVAGPRAWNSLPSHIRTLVSSDSFSRHFFQALLWHSVICSYSRCCVNCVCF